VSPSPVNSINNACSWLDSKGWVFADEKYIKTKLTDILFTVAIKTKLSSEVGATVCTAAYLIEDMAMINYLT
jgi:hypothetical protein